MRLHPPAVTIALPILAALTLAAATLGIAPRQADASPRIGVGPAECVQATSPSECDSDRTPGRRLPGAMKPSNNTEPAGGIDSVSGPSAGAKPASGTPFRFFSPTSVWNTPLADDAALDPDSTELIAAFDAEVQREIRNRKGPAINTTAFSVPIYTVPADQPTVKVTLRPTSSSATLRAAWSEVPLPADAEPAAGTDRHLVVWQPSTDRLWEFWLLQHREDGWHAGWGGAMQSVSSSSGVFDTGSWPGATPWWGASASSLSIAGGLITLEELEQGRIDHALAIALPDVRAGIYASPARRTDGKSKDPLTLPEGAHLRLDPRVDVDALHLPPLARMIAEAAQRYGILVRDGASSVALYAEDPTPTGKNPFLGPAGYFEGWRAPLGEFPWDRMQLLEMDLSDVS